MPRLREILRATNCDKLSVLYRAQLGAAPFFIRLARWQSFRVVSHLRGICRSTRNGLDAYARPPLACTLSTIVLSTRLLCVLDMLRRIERVVLERAREEGRAYADHAASSDHGGCAHTRRCGPVEKCLGGGRIRG